MLQKDRSTWGLCSLLNQPMEQELLGVSSIKSSHKPSPPDFHLALVSYSLSRCGQLNGMPVGNILEVP